MRDEYIQTINEKVETFSEHKGYPEFRKLVDKAISKSRGYGYECIACTDFLDRIYIMPIEYIRDWLDGKNELNWRKEDERMLNAVRRGCVDLLKKYPDYEIHKIYKCNIDFYKEYGHEVLKIDGDTAYVGKREAV